MKKIIKPISNKFKELKRNFLETGDLIFETNNPDTPICMLVDGSYKKYKMLNTAEEVWIRENFKYIKGKIMEFKYASDRGTYLYKVKTKTNLMWREPNDFRYSRKLCLKKVAPTKTIIDLCPKS